MCGYSKILKFRYRMELDFPEPVQKHQFTLRMIPQSDGMQQITECDISIDPECTLYNGEDVFGNRYVYGEVEHFHSRFAVEVCGRAAIRERQFKLPDKTHTAPIPYRFPSLYTGPGEKLVAYYARHKPSAGESRLDFAKRLIHQIYQDMEYVQGITDIHTTAEEALAGGKGVCQDYAHIMLALCRMADIPSRYVVGMMLGEGYSHAWVEVWANGVWYGMDPTNNRVVDDTYIKISHGRDYQDCIVNRGVFIGNGSQTQQVSVIVYQEE